MPRGIFVRTPEYREKMSKAMQGHRAWNKGIAQTDEVKGKLSESLKRYYAEHPETQKKATEALKDYYRNLEGLEKDKFLERRAERIRQGWADADLRARFRRNLSRTHALNPQWGQKTSAILRRLHADPEWHKKVISRMHAGRDASWADPKRRTRRVKAILKASYRRPTYIEKRIMEVIIEHSLPYKYTGDGSVVIGRFCPDFVNINGAKKIIEVFGNYWHQPEDEAIRKDRFAEYGFRVMVLWESQMKLMSDKEIADTIRQFTNEGSIIGGSYAKEKRDT